MGPFDPHWPISRINPAYRHNLHGVQFASEYAQVARISSTLVFPELHLEGQNLLSQFTRRTSLMKNAYLQRRLEDVFLFP